MRWLLTYADMITLLLGLFIVLVSTRVVSVAQYKVIAAQAERVFGAGKAMTIYGEGGKVTAGGTGILPYLKPMDSETPEGTDVRRTADGTLISMSTGVLFPAGSAELTAKAKEVIDKIYNTYLKNANTNIMIKGHTDNRPMSSAMYPSNWELSTGRAGAVTRYLISQHGVNPKQLSTAGYADQAPVAPNDTEENRAKNRRIEIFVLSGAANRMMNNIQKASETTKKSDLIPMPPKPGDKPAEAPAEGGGTTVPGGGF